MKNRLSKTMKHLFLAALLFGLLPPSAIQAERTSTAFRPQDQEKAQAEQTLTMGAYFDNPYQHTLQSDYKAARRTSRDQWTDTVWQNDVLDAKITVWAGRQPLGQLEIQASDFVNGTHRIAAENADIRWLHETMANIGSADPEAPVIAYPDVIHQGGATQLDAKQLKSAWITLTIPKDAFPGTYTGSFQVRAAGSKTITLTLTFEVLDLTAPDSREGETQIELWQHPYTTARYYQTAPFSDEHKNNLLAQLQEYAQMGGRGVIATIVEEAWNHQSYDSDPSMIRWTRTAEGVYSFDYTDFDQWIELAIQAGVLDPTANRGQIKAYSIAPWGNIVTVYDELSDTDLRLTLVPGSEEWTAAWTAFLEDFMRHTIEKGWFDITYISMDEREMEVLQPCVDLIERLRSDTGKSFKISSAMNYSSGDDYSFLDRIEDISVSLIHVQDKSKAMQKLAQHRREQGLLTTIYTCTGQYPSAYTISDMADTAWTMWYSMKQGVDGFLRWSWDGWVEDPLTDVSYRTFEPGDAWLIYPAERDTAGEVFYESPRYKMLKQGIRDINKAKRLQSLSSDAGNAVTQLVQSLKRPKMKINQYGSATYARASDRKLVQSEVRRMRNSLNEIARSYIQSRSIPITGVENPAQSLSLRSGKSRQIQIEPIPYNANPLTWIYRSSNEALVTVDEAGIITAIQTGTAVITAYAQENPQVQVMIEVTVPDPAKAPGKKAERPVNTRHKVWKR